MLKHGQYKLLKCLENILRELSNGDIAGLLASLLNKQDNHNLRDQVLKSLKDDSPSHKCHHY